MELLFSICFPGLKEAYIIWSDWNFDQRGYYILVQYSVHIYRKKVYIEKNIFVRIKVLESNEKIYNDK